MVARLYGSCKIGELDSSRAPCTFNNPSELNEEMTLRVSADNYDFYMEKEITNKEGARLPDGASISWLL